MRVPHIASSVAAVIVAIIIGALCGAGARAVFHDADPLDPTIVIEMNPPRRPDAEAVITAPRPTMPTSTSPAITTTTPTSTTTSTTTATTPAPTPATPEVATERPTASATPPPDDQVVRPDVQVPEPSPERDHEAGVNEWAVAFDAAHQSGDLEHLLATLHPSVPDSFGAEVCAHYVESTMGSIRDIDVISVGDVVPYEFPANSGEVRDVVPVTARWTETPTGASAVGDFHLVPTTSGYAWLTTCGTKLPSAA